MVSLYTLQGIMTFSATFYANITMKGFWSMVGDPLRRYHSANEWSITEVILADWMLIKNDVDDEIENGADGLSLFIAYSFVSDCVSSNRSVVCSVAGSFVRSRIGMYYFISRNMKYEIWWIEACVHNVHIIKNFISSFRKHTHAKAEPFF